MIGGIAIPLAMLIGVFAVTAATLSKTSHPPTRARFMIEVIGHQWWWEVRYPSPDPHRRSPPRTRSTFPWASRLRCASQSADVIHSFWVPQLQGKIDVDSRADEHVLASRGFSRRAIAGSAPSTAGCSTRTWRCRWSREPRARVRAWVAQQRSALAPRPATVSRARDATRSTSRACALCHTIRGTQRAADTWVRTSRTSRSRLTLAAGTIAEHARQPRRMDREFADDQARKRRCRRCTLDGASLQAIVAYLETLH